MIIEKENEGMKNRVGVITLFDLNNYGNRLQNHAVIKCLEILGFRAETVVIERNDKARFIKNYLKALIGKNKKTKFYKFYEYSLKYTNPHWYFCRDKVVNRTITNRYNFFSVGSDQVWNSKYLTFSNKNLVLQERLLAFTDSSKRMSFSASFSVQNIPEEDKNIFYKELSLFKNILVRENRGKEIIEELGKEYLNPFLTASVILDPTMFLTAEYWKTVATNSIEDQDYVLEIFICKKSDLAESTISKIKKKVNCLSINIFERNYGPEEFLELILKAKYIVTDSFHAVAFSILFEKNFMVFERSDKSQKNDSRFLTLFETLKMSNRIVTNDIEANRLLERNIDYQTVRKNLEIARIKGWTCLKNMIKSMGIEVKDE